ncbi:MAG: PepSY domain-containing protein [Gemmatimonadales bacterium]
MRPRHLAPLLTLLLAAPAVLSAQQAPAVKVKAKPSLLAKTKVTADSAEAIALAKVPNGVISEGELEVEHHRLIWSFDVKVAGQEGITEVNVDAKTGAVVGVSHEGPADEARENAQEKREHPKRAHSEKKDTTSHQ